MNANMEYSTQFENVYESNYRKLEQASNKHVENLEYIPQSYITRQLHSHNSQMDTDLTELIRHLNSTIVILDHGDPLLW